MTSVAPEVAAAASMIGPVLIVVGMRVRRPRRSVSWGLVAVGAAIHAVSTVALVVGIGSGHGPGLSQAIGVLAYPSLAVGVVGLTTSWHGGWWTTGTTSVGTAVLGTAVVLLAVTLPSLVRDDISLSASEWAGMFAVGDVLLAGLVARRVVGASRRNWSMWLLLAGFVVWGNAHVEVGGRIDRIGGGDGAALVLTLAVGPMLIGVGALLASMAEAPVDDQSEPGHAVVVAAWLVLLPSMLLVSVGVAASHPVRLWVIVPLLAVIAVSLARTAHRVASLGDDGVLEP